MNKIIFAILTLFSAHAFGQAATAVTTSSNQTITGTKIFSAATTVTNATASTTPSTGALVVTGGVGVGGAINSGLDAVIHGVTVGLGAGSVATNTAVGPSALSGTNSGAFNVAVGYFALLSNTTGYDNTGVGYAALSNNTTGHWNTAVGMDALRDTTTGIGNTAVGQDTQVVVTTGQYNTSLGLDSLYTLNTGNYNVAIGGNALNLATGSSNTAVGTFAGQAVTSGTGNVFFGYYGGRYETGSNKFFVDNQDRTNEATARTNSLIYGVFDAAVANQRVTFNANVGIGAASPSNLLTVQGPTGATDQISVQGFSASNSNNPVIKFTNGSGASTLLRVGSVGNSGESWVNSFAGLHFGAGDSAAVLGANEKMTILSGGNVGIGTTSPSALLSVGSSSQFQVSSAGNVTVAGGATLLTAGSTLTNNAAAALGTLTNAPSAGNPTKWIAINDNGTTRYIPTW